LNARVIDEMIKIAGRDYVISDVAQKQSYLYDEVEASMRPEAKEGSIVVKPGNTKEIACILKYANQNRIPVVVHGGGTGLCGGIVPVYESVVVSMERLNRIIEIDQDNMVAVMEAGVTLFGLLEELEKHAGICFPVHPGDEGAQMGGMAATNAGGARAVRHGVMRKHIQGLEVVLANGEILVLGGKLIKDNAGYNLMSLIIGSEGTLGVVTKVILKLYPEEKHTATIIASFEEFEAASKAVLDILKAGVIPLAVEYQDKHLFTGTAKMLGMEWQAQKGEADLMIIVSEGTEQRYYDVCRKIQDICTRNKTCGMLIAEKKREQADLLLIRSQHYEYIKHMIGESFDMAVPVADIASFLKDLKELAKEYNTVTNVTAHIADGNIHNDIVLVDGKMPEYAGELKEKMLRACFKYGGTITGEHGIGKLRMEELKLQKSDTELELMRGIKKLFDPNNILNPSTVIEV